MNATALHSPPPRTFVSTRSLTAEAKRYSFQESVLTGYADDGGMLVPSCIPCLSAQTLSAWNALSYQELLIELLCLFISPNEVSRTEITNLIQKSFQCFDSQSAPVSLSSVMLDTLPLHIVELCHGPTLTFKDIALQPVAAFLNHFITANHQHLNILVGTSGDTGSAAIESVRSLPDTDIYVLYPHQRISHIQELQMTTVIVDHVHVIAVDGTSDELDQPIKKLFSDLTFKQQHNLCSINSINVLRILVQTAHFFYSAFRVQSRQLDDQSPTTTLCPVSFSIPSGAIGHLIAALIAERMGLRIEKICVATNSNDVMATFIQTGYFHPSATVIPTTSCAIDIAMPYNIERLMYLLQPINNSHQDKAARVTQCMQLLENGQSFDCNTSELAAMRALGLCSLSAKESDVISTIQAVYQQADYLLDPHTAVGVYAAQQLFSSSSVPVLCLSTAHPAKFIDTVAAATKQSMESLSRRFALSNSTHIRHINQLHTLPTKSVYWKKVCSGYEMHNPDPHFSQY